MAAYAYGEPGELLFHYTRARTAFEHILPDKKIRLNPYRLMRDPLEAQHWPQPSVSLGSPGDEAPDHRELARYGVVVAAKEAAQLLSLTADADDYGDDTEPFGRGYASQPVATLRRLITAGSAWPLIASDFSLHAEKRAG